MVGQQHIIFFCLGRWTKNGGTEKKQKILKLMLINFKFVTYIKILANKKKIKAGKGWVLFTRKKLICNLKKKNYKIVFRYFRKWLKNFIY